MVRSKRCFDETGLLRSGSEATPQKHGGGAAVGQNQAPVLCSTLMHRTTALVLVLTTAGCGDEEPSKDSSPSTPSTQLDASSPDPPANREPTQPQPSVQSSDPRQGPRGPGPSSPGPTSTADGGRSGPNGASPGPDTPANAQPAPTGSPGPVSPDPSSTSPSSPDSTTSVDAGGDPPANECKRGIASNTAPGPEFSQGVTWWYNWAIRGSGQGSGIEFVPMIWGRSTAGDDIPSESRFLLGFNEPNFFEQADLSPEDAAAAWPDVEASASAAGAPIVSPAMNFCGPAERCHGTNPYDYLRAFFSACDGCRVDYVAVHWYNCDLPSLRDYLEPGNNLEGFEQFGRPVWLTEFSCNGSASVAEQEAFMREAIPYLEDNPNVYRYSWFSAGPIPSAELVNDDGSPTTLGRVYIDLPQNCR